MKTILYNPIFINPQAYYVFPRLTRYLQPDNESTSEPANYIGTIEVKVIAYGDTTLKRTYTNTDSIDLSEFKNTWIRISLFTKVDSCVLGEWKIGNMESDLPYIDPEVLASLKAVVIVGNKTNNDSDRAIVKNLVDASNPFIISNAAFKLNSGFGKYEDDFTNWVAETGTKLTSDKITNSNPTKNWIAYRSSGVEFKEMHIRILGIPDNGVLYFQRPVADGGPIKMFNGDNNIPAFTSTGICGFFINNLTGLGWSNLVIEQIPSFEGAFVTDGIDDLITSTKTVQEMLGGSSEITVVSMIHQIELNKVGTSFTNYCRKVGVGYARNETRDYGTTGIYGWSISNVNNSNSVNRNLINNILGDKELHSIDSVGDITNSIFSVNGYENASNSPSETSQLAWYWTFIANKVLTTDQINQVIAYFNLDRTLKPDILCNTIKQGITNENHAEFGDKLIDFSGNGRDIQLNNIAWDGDSGIGKYNYPNWKVTATIANTYSTIVYYPTVNGTYSINVNGVSELMQSIGLHLEIKYTTSTGIIYNDIKQDGVYSYILPDGATDLTLRFGGIPGIVNEPCNITITQIPSHAGALCLDGVNDFGKVTGMPIYKDYTIVVDYERISGIEQAWAEALISKSYIANQGAFVLMETNGMAKHSYSFGAYTIFNKDDSTRTLLYQSKYKCGDVDLNAGTGIDGDTLWLGTYRDNYSSFFNGAIYSLMSFPYSMSEFLIERQLKKHKLGTLYPNMVEFRPVIKTNTEWKYLEIYQGDNRLYNLSEHDDKTGIYLEENSSIGIYVKPYTGQKVSKIVYNGTSYIDLENNGYGYYYITVPVTKSPQKIGITIEQDENYVQWNPVVESNVEYQIVDCYIDTIPAIVGKYYPINSKLRVAITTKGAVDEVTQVTVGGVPLELKSNIGNRFTFDGTLSNISPQKIDITIDEYIRYEDIVQPYPVLLRFKDESGKEVSWGGKFRVGSTITRIGSAADSNLLPNIYNIFGLLLNDNQVTSSKVIVEKTMIFKAKSAYIFDNNEPKVILSPSRLRIPNSSYKLLGYIPDISGHGNHGKINNSAYAEGSGVNEDGSYQFDGVDDFVTIPTTVGGKQVLMKVNLPRLNEIIYDQRKEVNTYTFAILTTPSQIAYDQRNSERITYIDGILNTNIIAEQLMGVTHNIVVINSKANLDNTRSPILGRDINGNNWSRMRIYDFMLFDEISTDDKILELNEYVGIEGNTE